MITTNLESIVGITGTNAERLAMAAPTQLTQFTETDTGNVYRYIGSAWVANGSSNQASVSLAAGTQTVGAVLPVSGASTDLSGTITTAATSQLLSAAKTRKYVFFQNNSTAALTINFTAAATAAQPSIVVAAGASFVQESSYVTNEAINVYGATAGQAFTYKEA